ncbi:MAG TPA: phosphodiester glycosidase family protein [Anaerolineales bacterium]|nr:phosphodiester glycosidase family protein [Anaerolineales bacterium]
MLFFISCGLAVGLLGGAGLIAYRSQPQPDEKNQALFEGITYVRDTRQAPRPMVVHVVKVNLRASGIAFLVTPGNPDAYQALEARTTSQFLQQFGVQLAVNGDGSDPSHYNNPLDYYPHLGDPVDPTGFAASKGVIYSDNPENEPVLYISRRNRARFNSPLGGIYNAISGFSMIVEDGKPLPGLDEGLHPRTALALDKPRRQLIVIVVDGRQSGSSQGATLAELAEIVIVHGGYDAMNMDGGGSSTLVVQGENGEPVLLNSPIHKGIPGEERPVSNHLGIYAQPLP